MKTPFFLLAVMLAFLFLPEHAFAAATASCGSFQDDSYGSISECDIGGGLGILSGTMCFIRAILAVSMFEIYCSFAEAVEPVLLGLLTLYIMTYAIKFMFGLQQVNGKDFILRMIQFIFIFLLATNPEFFYFQAYSFIMGIIDGFSSFLYKMEGATIFQPDGSLDEQTARKAGIFANMDKLWQIVVGTEKLASLVVVALAFLITGIGAIVSKLIFAAILATIWAFFSILVTYAVAIIALTFLLMFTPVFMAVLAVGMQHDPSRQVFKRWVATIVSYTLQPLVVLFFLFLLGGATDFGRLMADAQYVSDSGHGHANEEFGVDKDSFYEEDFVFIKVKQKFPRIKGLTGEPGEDTEGFLSMMKNFLFYGLAFIIMNAMMIAVLRRVPEFAHRIAYFEDHANAPVVSNLMTSKK